MEKLSGILFKTINCKRGSMRSNTKQIIIIIGALVLAGLSYYAGYRTAARMGKEQCIATVTENCLEICGVGAEFCYPEDQQYDPVQDPEQEIAVLPEDAHGKRQRKSKLGSQLGF